jgi:copper(I)-binding protein
LLSSALLSGCGVGLQAQTYKETGRNDGSSVDLESVLVRNLHIEPPTSGNTLAAGGDAVLTGTLASRDKATDTLTSVTSPAAASVTLAAGAAPAVPRFGGGPVGLDVPAGGALTDWTATLTGLAQPLRAGEYVTVTLTFANAGQTTLRVPVHSGDGDLGNREVIQPPYGSHE